MTMTIGRIGLSSMGVTLQDPTNWSRSGDTITLEGNTEASTVADGITLAEQILGYSNNRDEPIVACTWSEESWFDGFYLIRNVSVTPNPVSLVTGIFDWSITLERFPGSTIPVIESYIAGGLATNSASITNVPYPFMCGVPKAALQLGARAGTGLFSSAGSMQWLAPSGTGEDGDMLIMRYQPGGSAGGSALASFTLAASGYYSNACRIEVGSTLRGVVGERYKNLPNNWRLSNGLIRITPTGTGQLTVERYVSGTGWTHSVTLAFGSAYTGSAPGAGYFSAGAMSMISVVRNSPECVVLRWIGTNSTTLAQGTQLDITLRRGCPFFTVQPASLYNPAAQTIGVMGHSSTVAYTSLTGGGRSTSSGNGGYSFMGAVNGASAPSFDLVNGNVGWASPAVGLTFIFGYGPTTGSAGQAEFIQTYLQQLFYPISESYRAAAA